MTAEKAFFYYTAIYATPESVIDHYARFYDRPAYEKAMANEFEKRAYRENVRRKIAAEVAKVDYTDRFTGTFGARFGEYNFERKVFPVGMETSFRYFNYNAGGRGIEIHPVSIERVANLSDFDWSLALSETLGNALLKSRPERKIGARVTYSVMRTKSNPNMNRFYFTSYVHSIELFEDETLQLKIGALPKTRSTVPPPLDAAQQRAEDERAAAQQAQAISEASSRIIGVWKGGWRSEPGTFEIRADGTYQFTAHDEVNVSTGAWEIAGDLFTITEATYAAYGIKRRIYPPVQWRIVQMTPELVVRAVSDGQETRWTKLR